MNKKVVYTKNAPSPVGPYSQAIEANGFIFLSGQIPMDAVSGNMEDQDVEKQTKKVMENIRMLLEAENLGFGNIVKTTIFITDMNNFQKVNSIYASYFNSEFPARSTVEVAGLPKNALVEIEAVAFR